MVSTVYWLTGPRKLELRSEAIPPLSRSDLRCRTLFTAISPGTELAAFLGKPPLHPRGGYPRLLGYCNLGIVEEVGPDVVSASPGAYVLTYTSHRSGAVIPDSEVVAVVDETSAVPSVTTAYLFHLGYASVLETGVRLGSRVCVVGAGVLGLTTVRMAELAGAEVTVITDHESSREVAQEFGAAFVMSRQEASATAERIEFDDGRYDVIVLTTNAWSDYMLGMRLVAPRGQMGLLGFPGREGDLPTENPFLSKHFYMKQLQVRSIGQVPARPDARAYLRFNERDNMRMIVEMLSSGVIDASPLILGIRSSAELASSYRDLLERKRPGTLILDWTSGSEASRGNA